MRQQSHFSFLLKKLLLLFISVWVSLLAFSTYAAPQEKDQPEKIYPVVNQENSQDNISKNGLSAIFKMRLRKWSDGTRVTVYILEDKSPLHKKFCKKILHVFPHHLRRIWNKAVFSGSGQAPIILSNIEEMISKIASTPGAVGYLKFDDLNDDIKILDIR